MILQLSNNSFIVFNRYTILIFIIFNIYNSIIKIKIYDWKKLDGVMTWNGNYTFVSDFSILSSFVFFLLVKELVVIDNFGRLKKRSTTYIVP